jgi:hypothetical protein
MPWTGSAPQTGHIGLGTGLINKHQPRGIQLRQFLPPLLAQQADGLTLLLAGMQRFFYTGSPIGSTHGAPP